LHAPTLENIICANRYNLHVSHGNSTYVLWSWTHIVQSWVNFDPFRVFLFWYHYVLLEMMLHHQSVDRHCLNPFTLSFLYIRFDTKRGLKSSHAFPTVKWYYTSTQLYVSNLFIFTFTQNFLTKTRVDTIVWNTIDKLCAYYKIHALNDLNDGHAYEVP